MFPAYDGFLEVLHRLGIPSKSVGFKVCVECFKYTVVCVCANDEPMLFFVAMAKRWR